MKSQEKKQEAEQRVDVERQSAEEPEYNTSPDAPYNRKTKRHLGNRTNEEGGSRDREIERTKQYYHGE